MKKDGFPEKFLNQFDFYQQYENKFMIKSIVAALAGLVAAFIVIYLVELLSHALYPTPQDFDYRKPGALEELIEKAPTGSLVFVIVAWALGSFVGGVVASLVAPAKPMGHAMVVACILMFAGLINLIALPHPVWFWIIGLAVYLPFAYLGSKFVIKSRIDSTHH